MKKASWNPSTMKKASWNPSRVRNDLLYLPWEPSGLNKNLFKYQIKIQIQGFVNTSTNVWWTASVVLLISCKYTLQNTTYTKRTARLQQWSFSFCSRTQVRRSELFEEEGEGGGGGGEPQAKISYTGLLNLPIIRYSENPAKRTLRFAIPPVFCPDKTHMAEEGLKQNRSKQVPWAFQ